MEAVSVKTSSNERSKECRSSTNLLPALQVRLAPNRDSVLCNMQFMQGQDKPATTPKLKVKLSNRDVCETGGHYLSRASLILRLPSHLLRENSSPRSQQNRWAGGRLRLGPQLRKLPRVANLQQARPRTLPLATFANVTRLDSKCSG
jgi:hypothetical protein